MSLEILKKNFGEKISSNINIKETTKKIAKITKDSMSKTKQKKESKGGPIVLGKYAYILVRIELSDDAYSNCALNFLDFTYVKNILVKDINEDKYKRILKKEIHSYYLEDDFLYLKLKNGEVLKIRYN